MLAVSTYAISTPFNVYYVVWTVLGVSGLIGAAYKTDQWRARRAVRSHTLDKVASENERQRSKDLPSLTQDEMLRLLLVRTANNGGDTDSLADVSARNEGLLHEIADSLADHIKFANARFEGIDSRIEAVNTRIAGHERRPHSTRRSTA